ncbi:MAG: hypothetical protein IJ763_08240 [Lachnospiraceae bacterium]|nr:hypothetical protein [Lachnospiraceae bacterium]
MRLTHKKIILSILIACFLISIYGCSKSSEAERLSKNLSDYKLVAEYALNNCKNDKYKVIDDKAERYVVDLSDIEDIAEIKSSVAIAQQDFSYIWIEDSYVIFWNDETKTMGLLYSEKPKKAIKSIKTWYTTMESEKIDTKFYIIGTWKSK